jgi:hypothetical protein
MIKDGEIPLAGTGWKVLPAVLISCPHFPLLGTAFTGERGNVPMRGCHDRGKAGEREKRRLKLRFQLLKSAECHSCIK